jgi:integrase
VYLGRDSQTGKQRYVTRTVHGTKREAQALCTELSAQASRGKFGDTAAGTLGELLERWIEHIEPDVAPSTIAAYRIYQRRWISPRLGGKKLDRLTTADIDHFYTGLRKSLSPASVLKAHTILRAALGQAVKWQMISDNPAAHASPPRAKRPPIQPPTPEQVAVLLAAAAEDDPEFALLLRLAAVTGARRGEICALRWPDLDLKAGEMVVARSLSKGERSLVEKETKTHRVRRLALDEATVEALKEQHRMMEERAEACDATLAPDAYVFARDPEGAIPWRPDSGVTTRFIDLRNRVGLDGVRLHDLRHYVATQLLDAGVPVRSVSERLGHANATTTLGIYAHAIPATDRRSAELLSGLLVPKPKPKR